jgi:hypothetical protein
MKTINWYNQIILLLSILLINFKISACDCPPIERDTLVSKGLKRASIVFLGEVVSSDSFAESYKIKIIELFKGDNNGHYINGMVINNCSVFPKNGIWIIYANLEKDNSIDIDGCGSSIALSQILPPRPPIPLSFSTIDSLEFENSYLHNRINHMEDWQYNLIKLREYKKLSERKTDYFSWVIVPLLILNLIAMCLLLYKPFISKKSPQ